MKLAILSDIHANAEALESVLADIRAEGANPLVCLGDIVGYGPDPNRCIDLVREHCEYAIIGNHDHAALGLTDTYFFNLYARRAVEWTRKRLTQENQTYLRALPFMVSIEDLLFVHASPQQPSDWRYVITRRDAKTNFNAFSEHLCFIGHSHMPVAFCLSDSKIRMVTETHWHRTRGERWLVNVGSVGQPRDDIPHAAYGIYDTERSDYYLRRVPYNVSATQEKMKKQALPAYLIQRLSYGR